MKITGRQSRSLGTQTIHRNRIERLDRYGVKLTICRSSGCEKFHHAAEVVCTMQGASGQGFDPRDVRVHRSGHGSLGNPDPQGKGTQTDHKDPLSDRLRKTFAPTASRKGRKRSQSFVPPIVLLWRKRSDGSTLCLVARGLQDARFRGGADSQRSRSDESSSSLRNTGRTAWQDSTSSSSAVFPDRGRLTH